MKRPSRIRPKHVRPKRPARVRPKRPSPVDVLNALARAEHEAREAVRRKHRRAAKRIPKRLDAYEWPAEAPERRSA